MYCTLISTRSFFRVVLLAKRVNTHSGYKHSLSCMSVNVSHELVAHVAHRRIFDVLVVVAQGLIAQL